MKIKIKKLHTDAIVPKYATSGAACFDFHAIDCKPTEICHVVPRTFRTGLAFDIPDGLVMIVYSRSGHGFKNDTRLSNCVGVIDSDYTGEVMVRLTSDSVQSDVLRVCSGDRIAQAMIIPVTQVNEFEIVDELKQTARGAGGFGSTGA